MVVERSPSGDIILGLLPAALAELLALAEVAVDRSQLVRAACEMGAGPGEDGAAVDSMVAERLLEWVE